MIVLPLITMIDLIMIVLPLITMIVLPLIICVHGAPSAHGRHAAAECHYRCTVPT